MSDYTSTYTESTGDTIDTTDFSTEFNAIEAAISTKADVDSDTLTNLTIGSGFSGGAMIEGTKVTTTSGTTADFTSIPSWVKKITISFAGVSTNGTGAYTLRIGDSGGLEATGYKSGGGRITGTNTTVLVSGTTEFYVGTPTAVGDTIEGQVTLSLIDSSANNWCMSGVITVWNGATDDIIMLSGSKSLTGTLDRLTVSTKTPDTFDAGTINILYEG
jgi:hypothetical protein